MKNNVMIELRKNIQVLKIYIKSDAFIGVNIYTEIRDNNKKFFKKKTLKTETFGVENATELKKFSEKEIEYYIFSNYRERILKEQIDLVMEEYKNTFNMGI